MLSIVTATWGDAAARTGLRRLALVGTRFTMQSAMFPEIFQRRQIEIVVPKDVEQAYIHDKYMNELFANIILAETRAGLHAGIVQRHEGAGCYRRTNSWRDGVVIDPP